MGNFVILQIIWNIKTLINRRRNQSELTEGCNLKNHLKIIVNPKENPIIKKQTHKNFRILHDKPGSILRSIQIPKISGPTYLPHKLRVIVLVHQEDHGKAIDDKTDGENLSC